MTDSKDLVAKEHSCSYCDFNCEHEEEILLHLAVEHDVTGDYLEVKVPKEVSDDE